VIPFEIMALIEDEEEYEDRNCGCPSDYHMSDCGILFPEDTRDYEDEEEDWR
jgi:hypothetical protein